MCFNCILTMGVFVKNALICFILLFSMASVSTVSFAGGTKEKAKKTPSRTVASQNKPVILSQAGAEIREEGNRVSYKGWYNIKVLSVKSHTCVISTILTPAYKGGAGTSTFCFPDK